MDYEYGDIAKMIDHSLLNPALTQKDLEWVRERFDGLLAARAEPFSIRYHDLLHTSPDVVAEHGRLQAALRAIGPRP